LYKLFIDKKTNCKYEKRVNPVFFNRLHYK